MSQIEIYSSRLCPYCWEARFLLKRKGVSYTIKGVPLILGWKPPTQNYKEMVERSGAQTTIPQIFVDGEYLGDEDTLRALEEKGELERALKMDSI
ncbi:MAG: glutaredoxin domain-containing protein [Candidatus Latescibacterota bacterium]|jgi:glutaredoxin 3